MLATWSASWQRDPTLISPLALPLVLMPKDTLHSPAVFFCPLHNHFSCAKNRLCQSLPSHSTRVQRRNWETVRLGLGCDIAAYACHRQGTTFGRCHRTCGLSPWTWSPPNHGTSLRLPSGKHGSWTYFNQHMEFKNMDILTNKDRNWGPKQNSVKTCFGNWRMHTFHQRRTQTTKFMSFQVMKCPILTSQHHPWGLSPRVRSTTGHPMIWSAWIIPLDTPDFSTHETHTSQIWVNWSISLSWNLRPFIWGYFSLLALILVTWLVTREGTVTSQISTARRGAAWFSRHAWVLRSRWFLASSWRHRQVGVHPGSLDPETSADLVVTTFSIVFASFWGMEKWGKCPQHCGMVPGFLLQSEGSWGAQHFKWETMASVDGVDVPRVPRVPESHVSNVVATIAMADFAAQSQHLSWSAARFIQGSTWQLRVTQPCVGHLWHEVFNILGDRILNHPKHNFRDAAPTSGPPWAKGKSNILKSSWCATLRIVVDGFS